jgi:hypothetical protein
LGIENPFVFKAVRKRARKTLARFCFLKRYLNLRFKRDFCYAAATQKPLKRPLGGPLRGPPNGPGSVTPGKAPLALRLTRS